ncbi:hypothetical protein PASE110613_04960 [Paenibacillus sediminis]|uniref:Uncharacterized protein n=1 Tax=Paenibacillus sediminis TaxID=664909 RepID=A0ABS4H0R2_9BACL|nr:hypothetical protein [Paenibacillus sediminis]MBP1936123.1 hypothetical protein [Paenibacillus sediminis]
MISNVSHPLAVVRFAMSGLFPVSSAHTYRLFAIDFSVLFPSAVVPSSNVSQVPMVVRLAISGLAPALSADT